MARFFPLFLGENPRNHEAGHFSPCRFATFRSIFTAKNSIAGLVFLPATPCQNFGNFYFKIFFCFGNLSIVVVVFSRSTVFVIQFEFVIIELAREIQKCRLLGLTQISPQAVRILFFRLNPITGRFFPRIWNTVPGRL